MTRRLLVGAIVAGALTVTAGTALALTTGGQPSPSATATPTTSTTTQTSSTTSSAPSSSSAPTSSSTPTSSTSATTSTGAPAPAQLTADDASRLVQARLGGTVHEVEREVEHGRLEWKVEITARDGATYDVRVDAVTGAFTRVDQDDRGGSDDKGSDDRNDDHGRHGGDDDRGRHGDDDQ
jgi:uncharacterized membrane protein YkoI